MATRLSLRLRRLASLLEIIPGRGKWTSGSANLKLQLLFVLVLTSLLQIWVYSRGFYSVSADESARTLDAYHWALGETPALGSWLPFHTWITGSALRLWPDLFWTPRIVSFIFGVLVVCSIAWLSHELFQSSHITVLSGLLGCLFPPRVVLSAVPLAEIMFIFLIVAGSAAFAHWLRANQARHALLSLLCFALASTVRYEGWIFAGVLLSHIVYAFFKGSRKLEKGTVLGAFVVLSTFPIYWIGLYGIETGNPLGFMTSTTDRYVLRFGNSLATLVSVNVLTQFIYQNLITLNILGILSLACLSLRNSHTRSWSSVPAIALVLMSGVSLAGKALPSHSFWRIPAVWSILLLPFTAHFALRFSGDLLKRGKWKNVLAVPAVLLLVGMFLVQTQKSTQTSGFTVDDLHAGQYIDEIANTRSGSGTLRVLVDSSSWAYLNVEVASQHPDIFVTNSGGDPLQPQKAVISETEIDRASLMASGAELLLFSKQEYKDILERDGESTKLKDFGSWSLYNYAPGRLRAP